MIAIIIPVHHTETPEHIIKTVEGITNTIGTLNYMTTFVGTLPDSSSTTMHYLKYLMEVNKINFVKTDLMLGDAKNLGADISIPHNPSTLVFMDAHINFFNPQSLNWGTTIENYLHYNPEHIVAPAVSIYDKPSQRGFGVISEISEDNMTYDLKWKWWGNSTDNKPFEVPGLCGCFMAMTPRTFNDSICGFTPPLAIDDREFSIRMWLLGKTLTCIPSLTVGHRFSTGYTDFSKKRSIEWGMGMLLYTYLNMDDVTTQKLYNKGIHSTQDKQQSYILATSPYWKNIRNLLRQKMVRTYQQYFERFKENK